MQTHEIRQRFTDHFQRFGHTVVPSASVLLDDPNPLFVHAGMVPKQQAIGYAWQLVTGQRIEAVARTAVAAQRTELAGRNGA